MVEESVGSEASKWVQFDFPSLLLGLALGLTLATLARVGWAEIPRRFANWLATNAWNFALLGFGIVCTAVIVLV